MPSHCAVTEFEISAVWWQFSFGSHHFCEFRKKIKQFETVEEDNQKLRRRLSNAKLKLRSNSKDQKLTNTSTSRCSFASRLVGLSEGRRESNSRERSNTDRSVAFNISRPDSALETYKIKLSVLQSTNDQVVRENAMLRLKCKDSSSYLALI